MGFLKGINIQQKDFSPFFLVVHLKKVVCSCFKNLLYDVSGDIYMGEEKVPAEERDYYLLIASDLAIMTWKPNKNV